MWRPGLVILLMAGCYPKTPADCTGLCDSHDAGQHTTGPADASWSDAAESGADAGAAVEDAVRLGGEASDGSVDVGGPREAAVDSAAEGGGTPSCADPGGSPHLVLGVPTDSDPTDDVLLDHGYYVSSYNPTKLVPNWVSWRLVAADLGTAARQSSFTTDPLLDASLFRVTTAAYTGSGYDRGHMCPSADRTSSVEANKATFVMTNVQPQVHEMNAGPWEQLESYERELARQANAKLVIIAGGVFDAPAPTIGPGVAVPKANYKIIVVLRDEQGACDPTADTEVIAIIMPNDAAVAGHAWREYLTTVDEIEAETGYDFLSRIPKPVQQEIESRTARDR